MGRRFAAVIGAVLVVAATLGTTVAGATGPSWAIQPTPNPAGAPSSVLSGVSCTAATACTAVGHHLDIAGTQVTLAEGWNGSSWAIQPTPNPAGAHESNLSGVSCTAATACTAVGQYISTYPCPPLCSGIQVTLAEGWNGSSWTIQPTPNPTGATHLVLSGVSCTAATACTAVGQYTSSSGTYLTLAERWNGTSWTIQPTPRPTGATFSVLSGVSCTAATACTAVGYYKNSFGTYLTLAERWNGSSWAIKPTPHPTGATFSVLGGVSCTAATACTAVGSYRNSSGTQVTLAERWNGSSWAIQPTPNPSGETFSVLSGVSCTAATACTAVRSYRNSSGTYLTLAERWNGSSWAIQPTPKPAGATFSILGGVSCTRATACTAVGYYKNSSGSDLTLAQGWNGSSWTIQPTPNPSGARSFLSGVSCTAATACTAVGYYYSSSVTYLTLAERWNGSSWTIQPTPNPTGAHDSALGGVSCTAATTCTAVGNYRNSSGTQVTLAERWNGSSWTIQPTPHPTGATGLELGGVSCTAATACTAVGSYRNSSGTQVTLAERWNGSSWTIQPTPKPAGATLSVLGGVSCTAATACTAVGQYTNSSGTYLTLAERWNGSSWVIQPTPKPAGATNLDLIGVSCTGATACTAVGYYYNSSGTPVTLAERWNGSSWTIQPTPNPAGVTFSFLGGVSCTATTACTAVGQYINSSGTPVTLAESWNGSSWTIQPTPNPAGATFSVLGGVSCTAATACTAVGSYGNSSGTDLTLAEGYS